MKTAIKKWLNRHPRLKSIVKDLMNSVRSQNPRPTGLMLIDCENRRDESSRLQFSWKDTQLPARQRILVEQQLQMFRRGEPVIVFDVFLQAVRKTQVEQGKLLEVGCSSAYYSEVMKIADISLSYEGCDYSDPFIESARKFYPGLPLSVQDATRLEFSDSQFDVVVSGCCILHIPEFAKAISETARVAKRYAIFHRTPVVRGLPNQYFRKLAYGIETIEIHFNEQHLLSLIDDCGLAVVETIVIDEMQDQENTEIWRRNCTYVCKKKSNAAS
jgi:SAM-dependent methyltransferase